MVDPVIDRLTSQKHSVGICEMADPIRGHMFPLDLGFLARL